MDDTLTSPSIPHKKILLRALFFLCVCIAIVFYGVWYAQTAPTHFPLGEQVYIPEGASVTEIGALLKTKNIIRSEIAFRVHISLAQKAQELQSGVYAFSKKATLQEIIDALVTRSALVPPLKVTIPEGATLAEFDARISVALPHIKPGSIVSAAHGEEGVLFPDTYLFSQTDSAEDIVEKLKNTFTEKLMPLEEDFKTHPLNREEVIILASIIEKEATHDESMRLVSGILQKRLAKNMPLQVDATFAYTLNKTSAELTMDDLHTDSPYNTYTHRGLPPAPIASPSLRAISAVLHPQESPYLYYLTDADGVFHYAATFDEHKANKARYLY